MGRGRGQEDGEMLVLVCGMVRTSAYALLALSLLWPLAQTLHIGPDDIALVSHLITAYLEHPRLARLEELGAAKVPALAQPSGQERHAITDRGRVKTAPVEREELKSRGRAASEGGPPRKRLRSSEDQPRTRVTASTKAKPKRSGGEKKPKPGGEKKQEPEGGRQPKTGKTVVRRPRGPIEPEEELPPLASLSREALEREVAKLRVPFSEGELAKLGDDQLRELLAIEDQDVQTLLFLNLGKLVSATDSDRSPGHISARYLELLDQSLRDKHKEELWYRYLHLLPAELPFQGLLETIHRERYHRPLQFTAFEALDVADAAFRIHWRTDRQAARKILEEARGSPLEVEPGDDDEPQTLDAVENFIKEHQLKQQLQTLSKRLLPKDWKPPPETDLLLLGLPRLQALERLPDKGLQRLLLAHPDLAPWQEEDFTKEGVRKSLISTFEGVVRTATHGQIRDKFLPLWSAYLTRILQKEATLEAIVAWNEKDRGATPSLAWKDYQELAAYLYAEHAQADGPKAALQMLAPTGLRELAKGDLGDRASGDLIKDMELLRMAEQQRAQEKLESVKKMASQREELFQREGTDREHMARALLTDMPATYRVNHHVEQVGRLGGTVLTYLYVLQRRNPQDAPLIRALVNQWQVLPQTVNLSLAPINQRLSGEKDELGEDWALARTASVWLAKSASAQALESPPWVAVAEELAHRGPACLGEAFLAWTEEKAGAEALSLADLEAITATAYRLLYQKAPNKALRAVTRVVGGPNVPSIEPRHYPWLNNLQAALAVLSGDRAAMAALLKAHPFLQVVACPLPATGLEGLPFPLLLLLLHATMSENPLAHFLVRRLVLSPRSSITTTHSLEEAARMLLVDLLDKRCKHSTIKGQEAEAEELKEHVGRLALEHVQRHLATVEIEQCAELAKSAPCKVALTLASQLLAKVGHG